MNRPVQRIAGWLLALAGIAALSALVVDLLDAHRNGLACATLALLCGAWGMAMRRAWRQRAWLLIVSIFGAPLIGVLAWAAVALQAALAAA